MSSQSPRFHAVTIHNISHRPEWSLLSAELREAVQVISQVLPFRCNDYVLRELIDWSNIPGDPMYQLTFPQLGMLDPDDYMAVRNRLRSNDPEGLARTVNRIRTEMNPHPSGQLDHNVPLWKGKRLKGLQHKYRETVLFFPTQGQTCHAYCTFCFRWAQFVNLPDLKFETRETDDLVDYLKAHPRISDLLMTGGDPLVMSTSVLRRYVDPLLSPDLEHVHNIRIGTKALSYWPQRFVTDPDADQLLRLFEQVVASGRHLALMAHYNHPVELSTEISREAVRRVRATGAEIRMQSPVIKHVNDRPELWSDLWRTGVRLGMIPYYLFVERDTGPRQYFELPLVDTYDISRRAYLGISGLARSVRGPVMSALPGKVHILGVNTVADRDVFVLQYLQARDPELVRRPFFAKYDPEATWFNQLEPAFDSDRCFFQSLTSSFEPELPDLAPAVFPEEVGYGITSTSSE